MIYENDLIYIEKEEAQVPCVGGKIKCNHRKIK